MRATDILRPTPAGLCCPEGDFYIDPVRPVDRAIITHGHSDHARAGHGRVLATAETLAIMEERYGADFAGDTQALAYGETIRQGGVNVRLAPAGHVLGSAQILVEREGCRIVVSGDYKLEADSTCLPFEPIRCHTFVTESTFGHPFFAWDDQQITFQQIHDWWRDNQERGLASWLYAYPLGKAQRLLAVAVIPFRFADLDGQIEVNAGREL